MRSAITTAPWRQRPAIGRSAPSRAFVDELLGDLRAAHWSARGCAQFLGRSGAQSWKDASARPRTVAELTAVHLALAAARPGPWAPLTWSMAVTHVGMLDAQADRLSWANRVTLLRALLPVLSRAPAAWTAPVALATDWIDGRLARREGPTAFGAYADAIADVAFWTWFVHRHETSRVLRCAADVLWIGPAAVVTVAYFVRGASVDYPRLLLMRNLSVSLQGVVTVRALGRAWRDRRHGQRVPVPDSMVLTHRTGSVRREAEEMRCPRSLQRQHAPSAMPTTSSTS